MNLNTIKNVVCERFDMPPERLHLKTREREVLIPRQIYYYFCKEFSHKTSLNKIALHYSNAPGKQDHSTVLHAIKVVKNGVETNDRLVTPHVNFLTPIFSNIQESNRYNDLSKYDNCIQL